VLPGTGDANQGPTGGAQREGEPMLPDNDLAGEEIVGLRDEGPSGPVETRQAGENDDDAETTGPEV
jgi:hypothetical protein